MLIYPKESDILFTCHSEAADPEIEALLRDYFQLKFNLSDLYEDWKKDKNFEQKASQFTGIRMLR